MRSVSSRGNSCAACSAASRPQWPSNTQNSAASGCSSPKSSRPPLRPLPLPLRVMPPLPARPKPLPPPLPLLSFRAASNMAAACGPVVRLESTAPSSSDGRLLVAGSVATAGLSVACDGSLKGDHLSVCADVLAAGVRSAVLPQLGASSVLQQPPVGLRHRLAWDSSLGALRLEAVSWKLQHGTLSWHLPPKFPTLQTSVAARRPESLLPHAPPPPPPLSHQAAPPSTSAGRTCVGAAVERQELLQGGRRLAGGGAHEGALRAPAVRAAAAALQPRRPRQQVGHPADHVLARLCRNAIP